MVKKVCVVITARPSYSRIRSALRAIQKHPGLKLEIVLAGSAVLNKYGNMNDIIKADGFTIADQVHMVVEGENPLTMAKTTAVGLQELPGVFSRLDPDLVVTIADRFETIATSIAAAYMNIPLVHIQGGEQTGSIDDKVRHANTQLSDVHLVATEQARQRVLSMGKPEETVHITGCPSIDIAASIADQTLDFDPYEKYGGVGSATSLSDGYLVSMQHPVTNEYSHSRSCVESTLEALSSVNRPVLWFWPNMDAGSDGTASAIRSFREVQDASNFHFFKNMNPTDFLKLLLGSQCLVGNSSVGIRECSYLGVPVVNIGSRQQNRERGKNVVDAEYDATQIEAAVNSQILHGRYEADLLYGDGESGRRIAEEIYATS